MTDVNGQKLSFIDLFIILNHGVSSINYREVEVRWPFSVSTPPNGIVKVFYVQFWIFILKETWNNFERVSNSILDKRHIRLRVDSSILALSLNHFDLCFNYSFFNDAFNGRCGSGSNAFDLYSIRVSFEFQLRN